MDNERDGDEWDNLESELDAFLEKDEAEMKALLSRIGNQWGFCPDG